MRKVSVGPRCRLRSLLCVQSRVRLPVPRATPRSQVVSPPSAYVNSVERRGPPRGLVCVIDFLALRGAGSISAPSTRRCARQRHPDWRCSNPLLLRVPEVFTVEGRNGFRLGALPRGVRRNNSTKRIFFFLFFFFFCVLFFFFFLFYFVFFFFFFFFGFSVMIWPAGSRRFDQRSPPALMTSIPRQSHCLPGARFGTSVRLNPPEPSPTS